ncbi:helix-turn-helix domain-containing protein [bacterium]|nr:helix-turn-helix domain-containing protein [bacterium]
MIEQLGNEFNPDTVTPPGETLQELLETLGMTKAQLALRIGKTPKTIGEIINHCAPITPDTAVALEKALRTPASFWNNRERRYRESLARMAEKERMKQEIGWLRTMPVRAMIKAGWIEEFKDKVEQVSAVLQFFGVLSPKQWEEIWLSPRAAYRASKAFACRPEACSAWLRRGELQAQEIESERFDRARFLKVLGQVRALTRTNPEQFRVETVRSCAGAGVALVFTAPITGAPVYGATRWMTSQKALIQLSLRGKFEDLLWFTFFHEAGHLLMHNKTGIFIKMKDCPDDREAEADEFARDFLIPPRAWLRFIESDRYRAETRVRAFAKEMAISPAIVVGRLQHEGLLPHTHLNGLRRRFEFADAGP